MPESKRRTKQQRRPKGPTSRVTPPKPRPGTPRPAAEKPKRPPRPRPERPPGRVWVTTAFMVAIAAPLWASPIPGLAALGLAFVGHRKGDPVARWALVAGAVAVVVGTILLVLIETRG